MIAYGFGVLECDRISACHVAGNLASGRVLEKIGMKRELLPPAEAKENRQSCSMVTFSVSRFTRGA
jgi:RimJ/RimL family protein N-acetyltransferase